MTIPAVTALKLTILAACALALALLIHDRNRWRSTAELRRQQAVAEKAAHAATVANYRAAAEQARAADAAYALRVARAQAEINERTADDFEARISAARARATAGRLRGEAAARADSGPGRAAPVPALPAAAGAIAQGADQDGLPGADALIATEQAIQLDELIKWVKRQAAVKPGGT